MQNPGWGTGKRAFQNPANGQEDAGGILLRVRWGGGGEIPFRSPALQGQGVPSRHTGLRRGILSRADQAGHPAKGGRPGGRGWWQGAIWSCTPGDWLRQVKDSSARGPAPQPCLGRHCHLLAHCRLTKIFLPEEDISPLCAYNPTFPGGPQPSPLC